MARSRRLIHVGLTPQARGGLKLRLVSPSRHGTVNPHWRDRTSIGKPGRHSISSAFAQEIQTCVLTVLTRLLGVLWLVAMICRRLVRKLCKLGSVELLEALLDDVELPPRALARF